MQWSSITKRMQGLVQSKIEHGITDPQLTHPAVDSIRIRELVVTRMLRCVDTLTLQCMILDYGVMLANETGNIYCRVQSLRHKIMDPALDVKSLGGMLHDVITMEVELVDMLAKRASLFNWNDLVAEREIAGQLDG